jgi:monoterpene epsilon-lactone hydrolase
MKQNYFLYEQLADPRSDQVRARLQSKKQKNPLFNPAIPPATQRSALDNAGNRIKPLMGQQIEPVQAGEVSGEWVRVNAQCSSRQVIFYLHGGAFFTGSCLSSRHLAAKLAETSGLPVLSINYRLAPENWFPAPLEDACEAYHWLLTSGRQPQDIVMVGDSAGGNLVLATLLRLRDSGNPLPAAAVLLSPWVDLAATGPSFSMLAEADPYLVPHCMEEAARRYLGKVDPRTPLASPLYGDLRGFPPVLIQVGSDEILLDDSVRLAQRIHAAGGRVDLEIWQGMWHVWHYFASQIPEGQLACERIGSFLHIALGQTSPARQEREATTREDTWSWQQEARQLRCRALELPGIDQCPVGGKRTMKLVA